MRNWFLGQGTPMFAEAALLIAGLLTLWITGRIYKRLIREADLMGTSDQRLIKYIKLKVTSYYKIGMHPEDTRALIGRYIKKYRAGLFSLRSWSRIPYLIMMGMLTLGGLNLLYRWNAGAGIYQMSQIFGIGLLGAVVLTGVMLFMDFDGKETLLIQSISDYVDNYLGNKLAQEYSEQMGKVSPEQYKRALQEIAASDMGRVKGRNNGYYYSDYPARRPSEQNDEVDAKIVEDVLKEFLC